MDKELIIHSTANGIEIALVEDTKLVELHYEHNDSKFAVGDLYLGKIKKINRSLNAVFVEIGHEKDAFLHYTDFSPNFKSLYKFTKETQAAPKGVNYNFSEFTLEPEILKSGNVTELLQPNNHILVQVQKEPISAKGPRISCEISLAGRFIVLAPFGDFITISKKINSTEEKKRLQRIIESIKPKNFGVIVRTAAEGQSTSEIHKDMLELQDNWRNIMLNLSQAKPPIKILGERSKTTSILRDLLSAEFSKIVCDDKEIVEEIKEYIQRIAPDKNKIVQYYYQDQNIFDKYQVNKQIKSNFGKTVHLPNGGYIIIEKTEACHVIDVNSGNNSSKDNGQDSGLKTNLLAAKEIVRQIRLRDLGGIIIIDFIDLKAIESKKILQNEMDALMAEDRARNTVLPLSKFGLMQITRQRLRPEVAISTGEPCPTCKGTGKVRNSELVTDDIAEKIGYITSTTNQKIEIKVNPILYAYLTKGLFSNTVKKWNKQFNTKLKITQEDRYSVLQYTFHDLETGEEINM